MILNVPYFRQDTDYSCGPATVEMLLAYFGFSKSECNLIKLLKTNSIVGTKHQPIINELTEQGLFCYVNDDAKIEDISYYLDKQLPIMVHFIEPSSNEGHYSLVVGHERSTLILNDPWNGEGFEISKKDFEERWKDEEGNTSRWMLVASKEDFGLGKQYRPNK